MHARRGERAAYRPIETPLCPGAAPLDVAAALLALAPFRTLYIADLDAIAGRSGHAAELVALAAANPGIELWVDAGITARRGPGRSVIGTESLTDDAQARRALGGEGIVLSLDSDAAGPLDPAGLSAQPALWPDDVVVMTLARVGSNEGPDLARLGAVRARAGHRRVHAAGGVRHVQDLDELMEAGAAGVLLASALHDGRLTAADLARFTG